MITKPPRRPALLIILDGVGVNPSRLHNGVALARTPRLDEYFAHHPHTLLQASGKAVGLPDGQMGNSEVGHLALGCGAIVRQDLVRIGDAIDDRSFFENPALCEAVEAARAADRPLHLLGLVSDGGVHSHLSQLLALIELCRRHGVQPVLHMITDGRDTPPRSALNYLAEVEPALQAANGCIATLCGRFYAMDRDNRWERTEAAWRMLLEGVGRNAADACAAIKTAYEEGHGDEFILPTIIDSDHCLHPGDPVVFFNFRKDRARQLTAALFRDDSFDSGWDRFGDGDFTPVSITCMTEYDEWFDLPYAFKQERPRTTLAEEVSRVGLAQFHCAETEKYAHVTYFFNGGHGEAFTGEERVIIDSPKVETYDLQPEMSAAQVADAVIDALQSQRYALLVVNFANGDMVGHSGVPAAIIAAVETLDREVGRVLDAACENDYAVILTADHGNCEEMLDPISGEPQTQHTPYPVPCLVIDPIPWKLTTGAGLSAIAPALLQLLGLSVPEAMNGGSLLLTPLKN
jgi:2,3-bisphosphoglycerate-independent phosphoglycerate mutase